MNPDLKEAYVKQDLKEDQKVKSYVENVKLKLSEASKGIKDSTSRFYIVRDQYNKQIESLNRSIVQK